MKEDIINFREKPIKSTGVVGIGAGIFLFLLLKNDPHVFDSIFKLVPVDSHVDPALLGHSGVYTCEAIDKAYPTIADPRIVGYNFTGPPTASCAELQAVLVAHNSPYASLLPEMYLDAVKRGVNPAALLAAEWVEGHYATVPGVQQGYENLGAERYARTDAPYPNYTLAHDNAGDWMNFHVYDKNGQPWGYVASSADYAALVDGWAHWGGNWNGAIKHAGDGSIQAIIPILAPSNENDVQKYIESMKESMNRYYLQSLELRHKTADMDAATLLAMGSSAE